MLDKHHARLIEVTLDAETFATASEEVEYERRQAIDDLIADSAFVVIGNEQGPYSLRLALHEGKLLLDIGNSKGPVVSHLLSLTPFRRIIAEYLDICESYFVAVKQSTAEQIQAIDMGRRGLHNQGSERLQERLTGKIDVDFETSRRLFSLICVLMWKGRLL